MKALWPELGTVDNLLIESSQYLMDAVHEFRLRKIQIQSKGAKNKVKQYNFWKAGCVCVFMVGSEF